MNTPLTGRRVLNMVSGGSDWYRMANKADPVQAEVWIYDEIGWFGTTAGDFATALADVTAPAIKLHLSSLGGDVFDGVAIYNSLRSHPARVTVQVDGVAASIASVIAQAGDERTMMTGSQMMIHEAWGMAVGDATAMREYAEILERQTENIAGIYAERAGDGRKKPHFRSMMRDETWMSPEEAIAEGLADSVVKPTRAEKEPEPAAAKAQPIDWVAHLADATIGA